MLIFNKLFIYKIISVIVIIAFTVTSMCYGVDLPKKCNLRVPVGGSGVYERLAIAVETLKQGAKKLTDEDIAIAIQIIQIEDGELSIKEVTRLLKISVKELLLAEERGDVDLKAITQAKAEFRAQFKARSVRSMLNIWVWPFVASMALSSSVVIMDMWFIQNSREIIADRNLIGNPLIMGLFMLIVVIIGPVSQNFKTPSYKKTLKFNTGKEFLWRLTTSMIGGAGIANALDVLTHKFGSNYFGSYSAVAFKIPDLILAIFGPVYFALLFSLKGILKRSIGMFMSSISFVIIRGLVQNFINYHYSFQKAWLASYRILNIYVPEPVVWIAALSVFISGAFMALKEPPSSFTKGRLNQFAEEAVGPAVENVPAIRTCL